MNQRMVRHLILYVVLGIVVGLGVYYIWLRPPTTNLADFASVKDTFSDITPKEAAVVYFIRVKSYDSAQIRAVASSYVNQEMAKPELTTTKRRTVLMHFFVEGDTASLGTDMLDELSYTNPEVSDPSNTLLLVPGGFVMKVVYAANAQSPTLSELKRTSFYMARPGINAKDLR